LRDPSNKKQRKGTNPVKGYLKEEKQGNFGSSLEMIFYHGAAMVVARLQ
jgi:hypothetical protein